MPDNLDTRQQIIMAAIQLLGEKGFADMSMNDIVNVSGISKGGVYWHFKSKDEIIQAIFDFFFNAQLQLVETTLQSEGTTAQKLERIFRLASEEAVVNFPPPMEFYALATRSEALKQRLSDYFETYRQRITDLIRMGNENGEFETGDPAMAAVNIISLLEGIVLIGLSVPHTWDFQKQIDNAIELVMGGLSKRR